MQTLRQYLVDNARHYDFRIRSIVPLDDEVMTKVERVLTRYVPIDMSAVNRTILQRNPLDFPGIDAEVYWFDVSLSQPVSAYLLHQALKAALGVPDKFIIVRSPNDPLEVEDQRLNALKDIEEEAKAAGLSPAALMSSDPAYHEVIEHPGSDYYGAAYNARFVDYLKKVQEANAPEVIQPSSTIFDWLPKKEPAAKTSNDDLPAPVPGPENVPQSQAKTANLDNNTQTYSRTYRDKSGKLKVLSKTVSATQEK